MSSEQERACKNPIEDQRKQALAHYEEASSAIHHWSSFVANAIKAYNPDSGEQQPVTEELVKQAITDFVFEVAKFGKFKHQPYGAILLEVGLWVSENKWLQNKLTQPPTSEPGNVVTGELYWKRRCLASEEIYRLLNLGLVHSKEYLVWEKLKNQEVEPGQP